MLEYPTRLSKVVESRFVQRWWHWGWLSDINWCKRETRVSSPPLSHLRSILLSPPSPPTLPYSPSPHIGPLTWNEIHHPHRPHKIHDLLWKISHQSLPIGIKIARISIHS